ncbi:MAG: hypothetical protein J7M18_01695 [Candidatus Eremiobacteraeota bacterium]|nr:hypothetical protein [Candidatus Eremiobacteraeota bacterium]
MLDLLSEIRALRKSEKWEDEILIQENYAKALVNAINLSIQSVCLDNGFKFFKDLVGLVEKFPEMILPAKPPSSLVSIAIYPGKQLQDKLPGEKQKTKINRIISKVRELFHVSPSP